MAKGLTKIITIGKTLIKTFQCDFSWFEDGNSVVAFYDAFSFLKKSYMSILRCGLSNFSVSGRAVSCKLSTQQSAVIFARYAYKVS